MFTDLYWLYFIRNPSLVVEWDDFLGGTCPYKPQSENSVSRTYFLSVSFEYGLETFVCICAIISKTKFIENGPGVVANGE